MALCKICCASEMIVGRWYKLVAYPISSEVPCNYWVRYSCDADNVTLIHDTVYIKAAGTFTVRCTDMYGAVDSVTISAIEEPDIERTVHEVIPKSWSDLQMQVDAIGENAYINIPQGEYTFDLTADLYSPPSGVVLDFNGSTILVTTHVADTEAYHAFRITGNHCGIKNAVFRGVDVGKGSSYRERTTHAVYEQCNIIMVYSGDYHKIENLAFEDVAGFNLSLGAWPSYWNFKPSATASRWRAVSSYNGYIADDGSIAASADAWTMTDMVEIINTPDRSYGVGHSGMWIPTTVRLYDIAFYDADGKFIELHRNQQYFRRYYYPENAAFVRYCVHQAAEPTENTGRDDYCIMRMMGGSSFVEEYPVVRECLIDNIVHRGHASGCFSGVGLCEDVHISRMLAPGNGWLNGWAFDIEDSWNSAMGYVVSHSYFGNGMVVFHSVQGVSLVSSIGGELALASNVHFPTVINALLNACTLSGVRCNATALNSYWGAVTDSEGHANSYKFGALDAAEVSTMRTRIKNAMGEW